MHNFEMTLVNVIWAYYFQYDYFLFYDVSGKITQFLINSTGESIILENSLTLKTLKQIKADISAF